MTFSRHRHHGTLVTISAGLILLLLGSACRVVQTTAELPARAVSTVTPGQQKKQAVDPVEMQQTVLRFADEFTTETVIGVEALRRGTNELSRAEQLRIKLGIATQLSSIATGPNSLANLLDMTTFVTVMRTAIEHHWQPNVYGESADTLLNSCRNNETEIWRIASDALNTNQLQQLRETIQSWQEKNPSPGGFLGARTLALSSVVTKTTKADQSAPGSLFSLLMLDPLAGMDPAVREIAQTRLLAERALYLTRLMPTMLRWQTELLGLNASDMPAVQQVVSNSTAISASLERFATVAEKLPDQVSAEREEILKALQAQEKDLSALMNAGTDMSDSLNTTLTTFDALMRRFGVGETNNSTPASTNTEAFRIQDYTATAAQLDATARQLTELLTTLDHTLGSTNLTALSEKVSPAVEKAAAGGKAVVDYAFWKGVFLILIALVAALVYKFAAGRMCRRREA